MLFKIIELSEQMEKGIVEFGQTSYYPKIMSGAFIEWIYYGFSSFNKLVLMLLRKITRLNLFKIKFVCLQAKVHQSHLSVLYFKPS